VMYVMLSGGCSLWSPPLPRFVNPLVINAADWRHRGERVAGRGSANPAGLVSIQVLANCDINELERAPGRCQRVDGMTAATILVNLLIVRLSVWILIKTQFELAPEGWTLSRQLFDVRWESKSVGERRGERFAYSATLLVPALRGLAGRGDPCLGNASS
jgi:hypothetical protein